MTRQGDLFDALARTRRDLGIERAGNRVDREHDDWRERAAALLRDYALQVRQPFLIEDASVYAYACGLPVPREPRAWGSAVQTAKRRGYIVGAGYAPSKSSNLSPKCTWRAATQ